MNLIHPFRHSVPLFRLYRDEKRKQCPESYLKAQKFYREREQNLRCRLTQQKLKLTGSGLTMTRMSDDDDQDRKKESSSR